MDISREHIFGTFRSSSERYFVQFASEHPHSSVSPNNFEYLFKWIYSYLACYRHYCFLLRRTHINIESEVNQDLGKPL